MNIPIKGGWQYVQSCLASCVNRCCKAGKWVPWDNGCITKERLETMNIPIKGESQICSKLEFELPYALLFCYEAGSFGSCGTTSSSPGSVLRACTSHLCVWCVGALLVVVCTTFVHPIAWLPCLNALLLFVGVPVGIPAQRLSNCSFCYGSRLSRILQIGSA
jgi:hypothetical protein